MVNSSGVKSHLPSPSTGAARTFPAMSGPVSPQSLPLSLEGLPEDARIRTQCEEMLSGVKKSSWRNWAQALGWPQMSLSVSTHTQVQCANVCSEAPTDVKAQRGARLGRNGQHHSLLLDCCVLLCRYSSLLAVTGSSSSC